MTATWPLWMRCGAAGCRRSEVSSRVRLTKTSADYLKTRDKRRELPYEAMLACGRATWTAGEKIRVYRTKSGSGGVIDEFEDEVIETVDRRDYDCGHYEHVLRETFAVRLARAFTPVDYEAVFGDPEQLSLFAPSIGEIRTILTKLPGNALANSSGDPGDLIVFCLRADVLPPWKPTYVSRCLCCSPASLTPRTPFLPVSERRQTSQLDR